MTLWQKCTLFLSRVALGWLFLYSGASKLMNGQWSAAGYIKGAKTFTGFYQWLADSAALPAVNFLNVWGQLLLGVSLILGFGVRLGGILGALLMLLYYFPVLDFPYPNTHSFLVDEHIVYATLLLFFSALRAGRIWGLDALISARVRGLRRWFG